MRVLVVEDNVEIAGAMDAAATPVFSASQVIRVSQVKRLGRNCVARANKATAAAAAGGAAGGAGGGTATIAGISTTTLVIAGGVLAAAVVGGLAAADKLPGQGSAAAGSSR